MAFLSPIYHKTFIYSFSTPMTVWYLSAGWLRLGATHTNPETPRPRARARPHAAPVVLTTWSVLTAPPCRWDEATWSECSRPTASPARSRTSCMSSTTADPCRVGDVTSYTNDVTSCRVGIAICLFQTYVLWRVTSRNGVRSEIFPHISEGTSGIGIE